MADLYRRVHITRVSGARGRRRLDRAATEEPMEIRIDGDPFAVIMRTPGRDRDLTAGFLFAEGVVRAPEEIVTIDYCLDRGHRGRRNVLAVQLQGVALAERIGARRRVAMTSACGLCGRATLQSLETAAPRVEAAWTIRATTIARLPARLRRAQAAFTVTGGLHAAGLFDRRGQLVAIAEDVGRHNAVDKLVGRMFLARRLPLADRLLLVSGRASFEIVQKAFLAGIPLVAAVSAPSTLAIDLAEQAGITLLGFVRGSRFNVYAHPHRLAP